MSEMICCLTKTGYEIFSKLLLASFYSLLQGATSINEQLNPSSKPNM
jgi:hypothetical protein